MIAVDDRPPRWPAAAAVLALAVALHAVLLGSLPAGFGAGRDDAGRPVLLTRQIVLAPPVAAPPPGQARPTASPRPRAASRRPPGEAVPAAQGLPTVPEPEVAAAQDAPPEAQAEPVLAVAAPSTEPATEPGAAPAADPASGAAAPPSHGPGEPIPTYATRWPPPATLAYELRRGLLTGTGALRWEPGPDGYRLALEGAAFGLTVLSWVSTGGFDAHGLAPDRFTDRRRNRPETAANFRRDAGIVSYSGPPVTHALPPGAQDRLSWMVQLPAILEANPALREPGQRIAMFVTGARGDADVWTFVVQGRRALDLPAGAVPDALHLLRAPRKAFDTQAEAWLDPARGHLPVRARLATPDSGDATELLLVR